MLEYSGKNPDSGNIYIDKNGDISIAVYNAETNQCAKKEPNEKNITIENIDQENCVLSINPCDI